MSKKIAFSVVGGNTFPRSTVSIWVKRKICL